MRDTDIQMLMRLRADLFAALKVALEADGHCKHYEGAFTIRFPNYFEQGEADAWQVTLDCYKIGPNRHYEWSGNTASEAIVKAEKDIRQWIVDYHREAAEDEE